MKKSVKVISGIALGIIVGIVIFNIRTKMVEDYNKKYVKNYIAEKYPEYRLVDKKYQYVDFYSSYEFIEKDEINKEITCFAQLENKKTGMSVTVPFSHEPYKKYTDSKYGRKNIKELVKVYEKYWKEVNKIKEKNKIELHVANVEIDETDNCDIYDLTFYIKNTKKLDVKKITEEINKIERKLVVHDINYIIVNENCYKNFKPWIESNVSIALEDNYNLTRNSKKYDVCFKRFAYDNKKKELKELKDEYYIK